MLGFRIHLAYTFHSDFDWLLYYILMPTNIYEAATTLFGFPRQFYGFPRLGLYFRFGFWLLIVGF
jgi:hypothetical protein